jgi:cobalt/nickel transport system permease protein
MFLSPARLHIPDGFLSAPVAAVGWLLALILMAIALRQTRAQLGERQVPLMGVLAAFIFAAQAINFPIAGGTSGHLLGGALAAILMGPWAATLIMTAVIALQALLFQDGGLLVMGWNLLNMGALTAFFGFGVYKLLGRLVPGRRGRSLAAFAAAWVSVEVGAVATAIELALSGTVPLSLGLSAMAAVHALIGLGEGLITVGALSFLTAVRPALLEMEKDAPGRGTAVALGGGLLLALLVAALSPLASPNPDGLERVAERLGFLERAQASAIGLLEGYSLPGLANQPLASVGAVALGSLAVFGAALLLGRLVRQRAEK